MQPHSGRPTGAPAACGRARAVSRFPGCRKHDRARQASRQRTGGTAIRAPVRSQPYSRGWPVPASPPSDPARGGILSRQFRPVHKRNGRAVNLPHRDLSETRQIAGRACYLIRKVPGPFGCPACMATPATTARSGRATPSPGGERPWAGLSKTASALRPGWWRRGGRGGAAWPGGLARRSALRRHLDHRPVSSLPTGAVTEPGSAARRGAGQVHADFPPGSGGPRKQASDPRPRRLEGAQNSQIWMALVLIGIMPMSAHNGGNVRFARVED
jgi:hypothetical protein